ncbi:carbohydrate binding-domain-containing protein [Mycena capillaripes]|nr:carbohydrate binding-domain-containing protein [Mycena capillaripes]
MARLISIVLTAILASVAAAESLETCGSSNYFPSQYTCFDDNFLCPIQNGDRFIRCGNACYSTSLYSCSNTTLEPISHTGPEPLEDCGSSRFFPSQYVCLDGNFLCPFQNGAATLRCSASCYAPSQYTCTNGQLSPVGVPPPPCVPEFGDDEVCNSQGCTLLPCCPGLISVADKCRDPCQLAPSSCAR